MVLSVVAVFEVLTAGEPLPTKDWLDKSFLDERWYHGRPSANTSVLTAPLTISPDLRTILVPTPCRPLNEDAAAEAAGIAFVF